MKRPVTSLCRRPGKKDRLRGSLSPMREQFPPTGTLCGGQAELPGKSRPNEGAKTAPGGGQELCAGCAHGGAAGNKGVWYRESCRTGHSVGQRARPGAKTAPAGPGTVHRPRHGGRAAMGGVWFREASHWVPAGAGGTPGRKNSPRRGPEAVWMRDMGVTCPGRSV